MAPSAAPTSAPRSSPASPDTLVVEPWGRGPAGWGPAARVVGYVLAFLAPFGSLALAVQAFSLSLAFPGATPPTTDDLRLARLLMVVAVAVAVGVPAVGLVAAERAGRRLRTGVFAAMLVIGVAFSTLLVLFVGFSPQHGTPDPRPSATRLVCQEHSGGTTECPGG